MGFAIGKYYTVRENGKICVVKEIPVRPSSPGQPMPPPIYIRQCRPIIGVPVGGVGVGVGIGAYPTVVG
jgi:hypothetical protein